MFISNSVRMFVKLIQEYRGGAYFYYSMFISNSVRMFVKLIQEYRGGAYFYSMLNNKTVPRNSPKCRFHLSFNVLSSDGPLYIIIL